MKTFTKHEYNPIFGDKSTGTVYDVYVWKDNGRYRMDFSWRPHLSCAVSFSDDGIHWEAPKITLSPRSESGWEDRISRNCVLKVDGIYKMWYTGQARGHSFIGYAESRDGIIFERTLTEPVMIPELPFENASVMNPCVIYENGVYKMWYSAGETHEPNVNCYAESVDGINWKKSRINPIFVRERENSYEQNRVGGCQVIKTVDMGYLMFYIGYENIETARICVAKSPDGITRFKRSDLNPLISPDVGKWDEDACYKPSVIWNEEAQKWMLWYNGRRGNEEYIGYAEITERYLF